MAKQLRTMKGNKNNSLIIKCDGELKMMPCFIMDQCTVAIK